VNLGVVFVIRNVSDRRGELERAGGLLNLPAQLASDGIELRRGELLNTGKVPERLERWTGNQIVDRTLDKT
jgi:hypothetical protein